MEKQEGKDQSSVKLVRLSEEYSKKTAAAFVEVFCYGEPMSKQLGCVPEDWTDLANYYAKQDADQGLTFILVDPKTDDVIGFMLSEDFISSKQFDNKADRIQPILDMCGKLDEELDKQIHLKQYKHGEILHLWIMGVKDSHKGLGLSRYVLEETIKDAKTKGYHTFVAECTGQGSQYVFTKAGFKCLYEMPYAEFEFRGEKIFKDIPSKQNITSCKLMVRQDPK